MNVRLFSNLRFAPLFLGTLFLVQGCINSDHSAPPTAKEQIGDAVADAVSDTEAKQVELALRAVDDMAKIQSLKALSPHLIEMSTSDGVAYVTRDYKHVIVGNVLSVANGRNLTEDRIVEMQKVSWEHLPTRLALKRGNGSRKILVVEDPSCGYCRQLHETLATVPDVTVYSLVVAILGPQSQQQAARILCSEDPAKAWSEWMGKGVRPAADLCERGVERLGGAMAAAERLGVKSTPVMIFEDGTRRVGASSSQDIEKALQQAAAKRVSKT
ncbi:DsbC family protein [Ottowia sp. GY511]|uniref:Thiol:disulfide interchange protein n=1 Tax=Ottowia flava TaxID=2675430 RepID=A0ABW4KU11_9BURK|nr:DsbC family protein [Ottowia sp. GY511]TXK23505.1 DsbC family protein [Ottowia sp. GY511]